MEAANTADSLSTTTSYRLILKYALLAVAVWALISVVYACSVYMEATRPEPVDLTQYRWGTSRGEVLSRLGQPVVTTTEEGNQCDTYHLYVHGPETAERVPITIVETAADVFTLGLAEVVLTPAEMVTRNSKYPVKICYRENKVINVTESETPLERQ